MSEPVFYLVKISSTLSVVCPLIAGLVKWSQLDRKLRLFLLFLFVGLLADLAGWYLALHDGFVMNRNIRYGYDVFESIFLCWFTGQCYLPGTVRRLLTRAWIAIVPLWLLTFYFEDGLAVFETTSQVVIAFATSFCLLKAVEGSGNNQRIVLFLLTGIFFYSFCTFFFQSLLLSHAGYKIWYLHNLINITANLIYTTGFLLSREKTRP